MANSEATMIRHLATVLALVLGPMGTSGAQPIGPPISPQPLFESQPMPRTQLPPVYAPPVGGSARTYSTPLITGPVPEPSRGRAAECQHQATVDRVPRRKRGAYVHNCMMN
jgi:hypothetical protein